MTWRRGLALALLLAAALMPRLRVAHEAAGPPKSDMEEYDRLARLALHEGAAAEGVTGVQRPPGYPLFLAAAYRAFGERHRPVYRLQAVLGALTCLLVLGAARALGQPWPAALAAAGGLAISHAASRHAGLLLSECLFLPTAMAGVWAAASAGSDGRRPRRWVRLGAAGVLMGVAVSTRTSGAFVPAAAAAWLLGAPLPRRTRAGMAAVLAGTAVAVVLAVGAAGIPAWGEFVPVDRQLGANLWIGNNPRATGSYQLPSAPPGDGATEAIWFAARQPAAFVHLTLRRWAQVWTWEGDPLRAYAPGPWSEPLGERLDLALFVAAAGLGAAGLMGSRRDHGARFPALLVLAGAGMLSLTFVVPRFRVALLPFLWLLAGAGIAVLHRLRLRPRRLRSWAAPAVAVAVTATCLALAQAADPWGPGQVLTAAGVRGDAVAVAVRFVEPGPRMHPGGVGTRDTELFDGLWTGTGDPTWECVVWDNPVPYAPFRARFIVDLGEISRVQRIESWSVSPFGDHRIDRMEVFLSEDGGRFRAAGSAVNDRPQGRSSPYPMRVAVGGRLARLVEIVLEQAPGSGTAMPLCEVVITGRRRTGTR